MASKIRAKRMKTADGSLAYKVRDVSDVDAKLLGRVWPADVKQVRFYPEKPVENLYEVLSRNIPEEYNVRLTYSAKKKALRIPAKPEVLPRIKILPFRTKAEALRAFVKVFRADYLKVFYPKKAWNTEIKASLKFFEALRLPDALRIVKGRSCVGMTLLLDWKSKGKPVTLIGWRWVANSLTTAERQYVNHLAFTWLKRRMRPVAVAGVDGFNPVSQGSMKKAGFYLRVLSLTKGRTSLTASPGKMPYSEWSQVYKAAWQAVMDADYKKATGILAPAYKKYPRAWNVARTYAMVLGDYAEEVGGARQKALKKRSCALLAGLLIKTRGVRWEYVISARNEYYYHSAQFEKQYALGLEAAVGGHRWAYYTQGVGAANYAYVHAEKGRARLAALWAARAVVAWEEFFKYKDDYYNAYVYYALALGILGRIKEMEDALKKSAKLSKKPGSYREFAEVRRKISDLSK